MRPAAKRRLGALEEKQSPKVPLVWFQIFRPGRDQSPGEPPEGWDETPEHLRQTIVFNVISPEMGEVGDA